MNEWKKVSHENTDQKKAWMPKLTSYIFEYRSVIVIRVKEGHFKKEPVFLNT